MRRFDSFVFFDNHSVGDTKFDFLAAFNVKKELIHSLEPFDDLDIFLDTCNDWVFGYLAYDLKNKIEALFSNNLDYQKFPYIHFFVPGIIIKVIKESVVFLYDSKYLADDIDQIFNTICELEIVEKKINPIKIKARISKEEYLKNILSIKNHLQAGDIYEMNYCQEFYCENLVLDPFILFSKLNNTAKAPFSSFYRIHDHFCLCVSPERFLKKEGDNIISQPIKGTIKRLENIILDEKNKELLLNSSKDFSENVMIVDLVRNDLSRIAKKNSVNVNELAALYSYTDVHHLISTISCQLDDDKSIVDVLKALFPMGSMTGAPKIRSMQLIEKYEDTLRGLYSGSIGYITPKKDFDFNVVIRSIFYNQQNFYLSFMVGGAITIDSDPELEYEECLAKAKSIFKVLGQ